MSTAQYRSSGASRRVAVDGAHEVPEQSQPRARRLLRMELSTPESSRSRLPRPPSTRTHMSLRRHPRSFFAGLRREGVDEVHPRRGSQAGEHAATAPPTLGRPLQAVPLHLRALLPVGERLAPPRRARRGRLRTDPLLSPRTGVGTRCRSPGTARGRSRASRTASCMTRLAKSLRAATESPDARQDDGRCRSQPLPGPTRDVRQRPGERAPSRADRRFPIP